MASADFLAPEVKLIVAVDGSRHIGREAADSRRDRMLRRLGFTVLRLSADMVEYQLPLALECIREAIAAACPSV